METEQILVDLAREFARSNDLQRLLKLTLSHFQRLLGAERALFATCEAGGRIRQVLLHNLEWSGDLDALPISRSVIRTVIEQDAPLLIPDTELSAYFSGQPSIRVNELRMVVGVPVRTRSELIGILYADAQSEQSDALLARLPALDALSALVATGIEKAALYSSQRFRARFLDKVLHDLRNTLHVAVMYAHFLSTSSPSAPDWGDDFKLLNLSLDKLQQHLADALPQPQDPEQIQPASFFSALRESLIPLLHAAQLSLHVSAPAVLPSVTGWPHLLRMVFDNLIGNASKYANAGSSLHLEMRHRPDQGPPHARRHYTGDAAFMFQSIRPLCVVSEQGFVEFRLTNQGPAVPEALRPNLFEAYVTDGLVRRGRQGSGLGLSIVAESIERMGGRVWLERSDDIATCFAFTVPCAAVPAA